jgi:hypothetical protein
MDRYSFAEALCTGIEALEAYKDGPAFHTAVACTGRVKARWASSFHKAAHTMLE